MGVCGPLSVSETEPFGLNGVTAVDPHLWGRQLSVIQPSVPFLNLTFPMARVFFSGLVKSESQIQLFKEFCVRQVIENAQLLEETEPETEVPCK